MCDHGIRACGAPLPLDCETCGNGIREGGENCDGLDLTVDEVGVVPQCTDFGYAGGTLACTAMCELDFSDCDDPGLDTTAGPGGEADGSDVSSGGGGQVGEDGCACSTRDDSGPARVGCLALLLIALRRRRLAAALALGAGALGCGNSDASESGASTSADEDGASSSTGSVQGWPELWYGRWYDTNTVALGQPVASEPFFHYFYNVEIASDTVRLEYFNSTGEDTGSVVFEPRFEEDGLVIEPVEGADHIEWPPAPEGRARALVRPGADCSELELEMVFTAVDMPHVSTLRRGRICLVVPCDADDGAQCEVTVDLCTEDPASTTCETR